MNLVVPRHGLAHSLAIWLLVFAGGWFVMLTELIGARALAPYFGNTIYVWGSVIAIFLLALAIGYALGGKMTQRFSSSLAPTLLVAAAGLYVAVTPFFQDSICLWLANSGMHVKWGALISAIILYGAPMVLLGGLSPYCVQMATKTHTEVGRRAGALYSVSTIGSFIGCLITAFVLIPGLPLTHTTFFAGIAVAWVALAVALALRDRLVLATVALIPLVGCLVYVAVSKPGRQWHSDIPAYAYPLKGRTLGNFDAGDLAIHLRGAQTEAAIEAGPYGAATQRQLLAVETPYHHMSIVQTGSSRQMIFGNPGFRGPQSTIDLRNLNYHVAEYTHLMFAGLLFAPPPKRVCVIGVGGGVIPRAMELCAPGVKIDAVDIDPAVIHAAVKYFYWRPSKNVRVFGQDGRSFINWSVVNGQPPYDWIVLDAYSEDYVPFHLTTLEFFHTLSRILAPGGIVTANVSISDDLYGCEARTLNAVFGNVTAFVGHRSANIILVSQNGRTKPMDMREAAKAARKVKLPPEAEIDIRPILSALAQEPNWSAEGPILRDIWAPVENLLK